MCVTAQWGERLITEQMFGPHLHPFLLTSCLLSIPFPLLFPIYLLPIFVSSPLSHFWKTHLPINTHTLSLSFLLPWSVPWRISRTLPYPHLPIRDTVVVNQQLRRREQERKRVTGKRGVRGRWGFASAPQTAPPWKLRLAYKHDLTVSLVLFSLLLTFSLNVSALITVIPLPSFPLLPCAWPLTPVFATFSSLDQLVYPFRHAHKPMYPFTYQSCALWRLTVPKSSNLPLAILSPHLHLW